MLPRLMGVACGWLGVLLAGHDSIPFRLIVGEGHAEFGVLPFQFFEAVEVGVYAVGTLVVDGSDAVGGMAEKGFSAGHGVTPFGWGGPKPARLIRVTPCP